MRNTYLSVGALLGALAVALGAFGAHGLKKIVPAETVTTFQTGVQYQMYHSLALLLTGIILDKLQSKWITRAGVFFIAGIILFSGSLYLLTAFEAGGQVGLKGVGIITPFGGVCFILGWIFLFLGVVKRN